MYVNEKLCKNITVMEKYCEKYIEMFVVSLWPFYLPREVNVIYTVVVYIPPDSNYNAASDKLYVRYDTVNDLWFELFNEFMN